MANEVFISYSRKDYEKVRKIKEEIDRTVGINCWMDLDGIESDKQFVDVIINAINRHETILFMLSKSSMYSTWALKELLFAEDKKKRIVLVLIDNSKMTDEFSFLYGDDVIDWNAILERKKLLSNLKTWHPVSIQDMGIRLNKVLRELNIGLQTTIDFLKAHKELGDISDDATVNTKIEDNQYEALANHFKGTIRLNKVLTELNIGLKTAVDFLKLHEELGDIRDDATPNTKISVGQYNALVKEFGGKTYPKTQSDISLFRKSDDKDVRILGKIDLSSIAKPIGNSGKKYDVFVSYSRLDTNKVQAIVGEIEKKGYRVWIDKKGIDSGDEFKTTIVKAIRNSEVFLFFSSKGANESTWTMKEVNTAVHFKKAIIPVKLDNTEYDDSILLELVGLDYVDFTFGSQHSYAISKLIKALQKIIRI